MKALIYPFMILAGIGFVLSLIVHVLSLLNISLPFGSAPLALHFGIFIVFFPALMISQKFITGMKRTDFWKEGLRGCPKWMRHITIVCSYYALINFAIFIFLDSSKGHTGPGTPSPLVFRGFSGHWMAFYSFAFATLYSHMRTKGHEL